jgi:hypothetical protein
MLRVAVLIFLRLSLTVSCPVESLTQVLQTWQKRLLLGAISTSESIACTFTGFINLEEKHNYLH